MRGLRQHKRDLARGVQGDLFADIRTSTAGEVFNRFACAA
jgi:hypothetical protein